MIANQNDNGGDALLSPDSLAIHTFSLSTSEGRKTEQNLSDRATIMLLQLKPASLNHNEWSCFACKIISKSLALLHNILGRKIEIPKH
jgi:hypothetical protein